MHEKVNIIITVLYLDVDECSPVGDCMHICENTVGSYTCKCNSDFKVDDTDPKKCVRKCIANWSFVIHCKTVSIRRSELILLSKRLVSLRCTWKIQFCIFCCSIIIIQFCSRIMSTADIWLQPFWDLFVCVRGSQLGRIYFTIALQKY